jgi:uncharacterized protein YuzE
LSAGVHGGAQRSEAQMGEALGFLEMLPALKDLAEHRLSMSYDVEADVLYVNFKELACADGGELGEDDVIVRKVGGEVIGYTVLRASHR